MSGSDCGGFCTGDKRLTRRDFVSAAAAAGVVLVSAQAVRAQGKNYKIALIQGVAGDAFYVTMNCGAQVAAKELGVTVNAQAPQKFDYTLQTPILNAVVQTKPDAILIAPTDATAMIQPIQKAIDAGIAVFTVDTHLNKDIALAGISSDNILGGKIAADALAKLIDEKGSVFMMNVKPGISTTDERQQGFEQEIKKYPNVKLLKTQFDNDDAVTAASLTSAVMQANPDLAGIFGTNLFSAEGAADAVKRGGKTGQIKIIGFDAGPAQVKDLKDGVVQGLIAQHPGDIGYIAVHMAVQYLNTKQPPAQKVVQTGYTVVTADNFSQPDVASHLYVADCSQYVQGTPAVSGTPTS